MRGVRLVLPALLAAWLASSGCLKPYHFDEDWWEEKVESRDDDWKKDITP